MIKHRCPKRIPVDYTNTDYYKFYKQKYKYQVSEKVYRNIISEMNKFVQYNIIEHGMQFQIPARLGILQVVKIKRDLHIVDGKVINTAPPDWKSTIELWNQDPEAKEKKIIVRYKNTHTGKYVYNLSYDRYNATYKNKSIMLFNFSRDFKRNVAKRINDYSKDKYNAPEKKIRYAQR